MKYSNEEIKNIIGETEDDKKLKTFFSKIKRIFGEDYACLILTCDYDMKKSINKFSSKFNNINSLHIQFLLLQAALLSENNPYKELMDRRMKEDNFEELFPFIASNIYFRKGLIRLYVNQCDKTNEYIFSMKSDEEKERLLTNINELKRYERFLKVQEQISDNDYLNRYYSKKKKKGNHK